MPDEPAPKSVDLGDLAEVVLTSVRRVLEDRPRDAEAIFGRPRIIAGLILEPERIDLNPQPLPP